MLETVLFLPLLGALIAGFGSRWTGVKLARIIPTVFLFVCAALSWVLFFHHVEGVEVITLAKWIESGSLSVDWSIRFDRMTQVMLVVVTSVSALVHLYSHGYMSRDPSQPRFFSYLSLFTFAMLMLVTANDLLQMFFGWEAVGLASYLLIGFWFRKPSANAASMKAFVVNRVGDFGFALGIFAIFALTGSLRFDEIFAALPGLVGKHFSFLGYDVLALELIGILLFIGAMGKSAQLFLHTWLPDAMEGPTPVSALVHSATMVAAGVYLVGRFYPVLTPDVLLVIAYVGAITLFIAATIALVANDIKRVLAYSTVSQLGYMMLALGVGGWSAGLFHLVTHAFFKSLLFLCSGSVIHACHTNDMRKMGGLAKIMPWTAGTMLVGCLAIIGAGVPFVIGLSGYYSKDAILAQALSFAQANPSHSILYAAVAGGAFLTAFYMFRLWFMTFAGAPRDHHVADHAHESPAVMVAPLVVLSVLAVVAGWTLPGGFGLANLLEQARPAGTAEGMTGGFAFGSLVFPAEYLSHEGAIHVTATLTAFTTALAGVVLAALMYLVKIISPAVVATVFKPVYAFLAGRWYFDELYHALFVVPVLGIAKLASGADRGVIDRIIDGLAWTARQLAGIDAWIDRTLVDGLVNATATATWNAGLELKKLQTGHLRQYVMFIVVGTVALFVIASLLFRTTIAG